MEQVEGGGLDIARVRRDQVVKVGKIAEMLQGHFLDLPADNSIHNLNRLSAPFPRKFEEFEESPRLRF